MKIMTMRTTTATLLYHYEDGVVLASWNLGVDDVRGDNLFLVWWALQHQKKKIIIIIPIIKRTTYPRLWKGSFHVIYITVHTYLCMYVYTFLCTTFC